MLPVKSERHRSKRRFAKIVTKTELQCCSDLDDTHSSRLACRLENPGEFGPSIYRPSRPEQVRTAVSDLSFDQEIGQDKNKENGSPFRKTNRKGRAGLVAAGKKLSQD